MLALFSKNYLCIKYTKIFNLQTRHPPIIQLNIIRILIEAGILLAIQIALIDLISIGGYRPDLLLIYLLFKYRSMAGYQFIVMGFMLGLMQDLLGGGFLGLNALVKSVAAFTLVKIYEGERFNNRLIYHLGAVAAIFLNDFLSAYIISQGEFSNLGNIIIRRALPIFCYNYVVFIIVNLMPSKKRSRG